MAEQRILKFMNDAGSEKLSFYRNRMNGYAGLAKALAMESKDIITMVKESGLRGRGGAGFPTGDKWGFIPNDGQEHFVLCNADEGEPGTFKDREILSHNPHAVIEGMIIAARAVGAKRGYIYIRGEFEKERAVLEGAVAEAYDAKLLGKNISGSGFDFDLFVYRGAGAYVCGEETSLISSLAGLRGHPLLRPPFPAVKGFYGKPTVVNNVETYANVGSILNYGTKWFRSSGTDKAPGTKIFCVSGHVNKPGVYELPLGTPFTDLLAECGGVLDGRELKCVIPGGSSTPMLLPNEVEDMTLDYESIASKGSMLGSGAVIVIAHETCMVRTIWRLAKFYEHESCGFCTPCREGLPWLSKIMESIILGKANGNEMELMASIIKGIEGNTVCALADAGVTPIKSGLKKFADEFTYAIENKRLKYQFWTEQTAGAQTVRS
ncbi:MAG: NADH-quinone oxidoreductase subunit NuoF [Spirochaetes bacterium]|nr:NADH-quinone oxidoreductase subunit NuoF [Spirochaetota bacterium]